MTRYHRSSMPARFRLVGLAAALGLGVLAQGPRAWAGETEGCLDAAERGEQLKKRGALTAARRELATCARDVCPGPVKSLCRAYLDEVMSSLPTLEVVARDGAGRTLSDVRVIIDGRGSVGDEDGSYPVDPGARLVRVEGGGLAEERLVTVAVGQKRTPVLVVLGARPPAPAPPPSPARAEARRSVLPWVVGGLGGLALAGSGVFALRWSSDATCRPACSPAETDRVRTDAVVTDVFLGVGLVAIGTAVVLFLSEPTAGARVTAARRTAP